MEEDAREEDNLEKLFKLLQAADYWLKEASIVSFPPPRHCIQEEGVLKSWKIYCMFEVLYNTWKMCVGVSQ